jgi:hypothetical protein
MGYRVPKTPGKRGWKLLFEWFDAGRRNNKGVPQEQWNTLGFHPAMTREEAQARAKQLNSQQHLQKQEKKRIAIVSRLQQEDAIQSAYLPTHLVEEFESTRLIPKLTSSKDKTMSNWRAAKRLIRALQKEPTEWWDERDAIYLYFKNRGDSVSYVQKVLPLLNKWGAFYCKKLRLPWEPVPFPRGHSREAIADASFDKTQKSRTSAPLTPEMLESKRSKLKEPIANWLFLSVWFGLRPVEIDGLHNPKTFRIEQHKGVPVLMVYQSKLTSVPKDKRWKPIPCIYKEQIQGLDIIKADTFKRPLAKTVRAHFGEEVTNYGGRKGFVDLMLSKNQKLEDISVWLGHTGIERTWRSYKNKTRVSFTPAA